jgi:hypothetical protein
MRIIKIAAAAIVAVLVAQWALTTPPAPSPASSVQPALPPSGLVTETRDPVVAAFARKATNLGMDIEGRVVRVLSDDRDGSRHQRFILRTFSGHTVLVAHNIDLAPRLEGLKQGDRVSVRGEYEWNPEGGVVHWTHRDPGGTHAPGYIDWNGRRFE